MNDIDSMVSQGNVTSEQQELFELKAELEQANHRLKECLNHNSLVATRSELNKKDEAIKLLAEALIKLIEEYRVATMLNGGKFESRRSGVLVEEYKALAERFIK